MKSPAIRISLPRALRAVLPLMALAAAACDGDPSGPDGDRRPVALAAGGRHTCALAADGSAWCWGNNDVGQLGNGTQLPSPQPVRVSAPERLADISGSWNQSCALGESGRAYCWGAVPAAGGFLTVTTPRLVETTVRFAALRAGTGHTCGVTEDGRAYCWGHNESGQLGNGELVSASPQPQEVETGARFRAVTPGALHTCGLATTGQAWCWGGTQFGIFGDDPGTPEPLPAAVGGALRFDEFQTGATFACGRAGGTVHCWGWNVAGELGRGTFGEQVEPTPAPVAGIPAAAALFVSPDNSVVSHACVLTAAGEAWCWGENSGAEVGVPAESPESPACGTESAIFRCVPTPVRAASTLRFRSLAPGSNHTCGVTLDDQIWCWGRADEGQLGPLGGSGGPGTVRVALPGEDGD